MRKMMAVAVCSILASCSTMPQPAADGTEGPPVTPDRDPPAPHVSIWHQAGDWVYEHRGAITLVAVAGVLIGGTLVFVHRNLHQQPTMLPSCVLFPDPDHPQIPVCQMAK